MLTVIQNGRAIEVPRDVEAKGLRAVARYVDEHAGGPPKRKKSRARTKSGSRAATRPAAVSVGESATTPQDGES